MFHSYGPTYLYQEANFSRKAVSKTNQILRLNKWYHIDSKCFLKMCLEFWIFFKRQEWNYCMEYYQKPLNYYYILID